MSRLPTQPAEAGFTLLEVVVAMALLGLLCAAAFGVVAAGMRASRAATNYTTAVLEGDRILNEILADGMAADTKEGILEAGYRWRAERVRASSVDGEGPAQLLRVRVSVWWPSPRGEQRFDLATLTMTQNQPPSADPEQRGNLSPASQPREGRL